MKIPFLFGASAFLFSIATASSLAQPQITFLGKMPGVQDAYADGISADGSTVYGHAFLPPTGMYPMMRAFRWTATEQYLDLGTLPSHEMAHAAGVNADGSVIVGDSYPNKEIYTNTRGYRWTKVTGMQPLPLAFSKTYSSAHGTSVDGLTVVGFMYNDWQTPTAVIWHPDGSVQQLGTLPGWVGARALAVSADGKVVVGECVKPFPNAPSSELYRAFRWTAEDGMQDLGVVPDWLDARARAISADGKVIAGVCTKGKSTHSRAFRWTAEGGMINLGVLPGDGFSDVAAFNADGSILVGRTQTRAYFHTEILNMTDLTSYLGNHGVSPFVKLSSAEGISADGSIIVCNAESLAGVPCLVTGFHVDACYPDCDASGSLSIDDFICFQTLFALGDPAADCDGDASLTIDDFICFQTLFAIGC